MTFAAEFHCVRADRPDEGPGNVRLLLATDAEGPPELRPSGRLDLVLPPEQLAAFEDGRVYTVRFEPAEERP
ncbi:hypothetical protein [Miltoncostaea marina]|uniref:hypothetical protein n=1 Tax=Miltoncostaea marina TaxID=2843215 RepID=UPI001C3C5C99|nr:hypothetical protein [Miltoncostaea marina]